MCGMSGNADFDVYRLPEDHEAVREAVRAVAEDKIAPYAAAVDEEARYPQEAHDALVASDFFAPHVPEEFGGVGADALATCIVIEEVARVCASSSLIPAVNKLGSMPIILAGGDDVSGDLFRRGVSLPCATELTEADQDRVVAAVRSFWT